MNGPPPALLWIRAPELPCRSDGEEVYLPALRRFREGRDELGALRRLDLDSSASHRFCSRTARASFRIGVLAGHGLRWARRHTQFSEQRRRCCPIVEPLTNTCSSRWGGSGGKRSLPRRGGRTLHRGRSPPGALRLGAARTRRPACAAREETVRVRHPRPTGTSRRTPRPARPSPQIAVRSASRIWGALGSRTRACGSPFRIQHQPLL
jgi:hypothetical protein